MNELLSEDLSKVASALKSTINQDKMSEIKKQALIGQNYYDYRHDILDNRIFYVDDNGQLKEDKYASNVKIPHPFFTELVDQKVQYLLSNPIEIETEDTKLKEYLKEYLDEDLQVTLQELVQGAAIKGREYTYARTTSEDKLKFEVADSLKTIPVYDENNELLAIIRYYDRDVVKDGKIVKVTYAERWTDQDVAFFVTDNRGNFKPDESVEINPRPHVIAVAGDGSTLGRSYGSIPFYKLTNNYNEKSDLAPIKALIDDYDLMDAFLSNNLQDFTDAIYVVKGFPGDDLSKLRQNIKAKKTVGTSEAGGVDIKTIEIPYEARKVKLELDKENIYKFGMGFDSSQVGDGNITNIVIKSRYALLDLKCNKIEARLRAMITWMLKMILADIERRHGGSYDAGKIEVIITRETMVNETDIVNNAKTEAETKAAIIQAIIAASPYIGDESTLKLICEQFELDYDEVKLLVEEQDYTPGLNENTDPNEDDPDEDVIIDGPTN